MARSKFNVDKKTDNRTYDNIVFDSVLEMRYYRDVLLPLLNAGEIQHYELQKEYILQPKFIHNGKTIQPIKYVADFFIVYKDGREEIIDTKGYPDSVALMKRKMFWFLYPDLNYHWVTWVKKYGGWLDYEDYKRIKHEEKRAKKKGEKNGK